LAEISIKITVDDTTNRDHIAQWMEMALALDVGQASQAVPLVSAMPPAATVSQNQPAPPAQAEQQEEYDPDPDDATDAPQEQSDQPAGLAPARRRGRRSNAEIAAERTANEAAMESLKREAEAKKAAQPAARPPGMALPPGITAPQQQSANGAAPVQAAPAASPTPVAMPKTEPAGAMPNGHMALEDFREQMRMMYQKNQKLPTLMMREKTWRDQTAKPVWYLIETVPAEYRERMLIDTMDLFAAEGVSLI
jgi:hypothetical protein